MFESENKEDGIGKDEEIGKTEKEKKAMKTSSMENLQGDFEENGVV